MEKEYFELKEQHLKLLKHSCVRWNEYLVGLGAAAIDPKRPYGNSDVGGDLIDLLSGLTLAELIKLHRETETALQICLTMQSFEVGTYEREWLGEWKRVDEEANNG